MGGVVKNVGGLEINISQISNWLPARARLTITFVSYNQPGLTCEEEIWQKILEKTQSGIKLEGLCRQYYIYDILGDVVV